MKASFGRRSAELKQPKKKDESENTPKKSAKYEPKIRREEKHKKRKKKLG